MMTLFNSVQDLVAGVMEDDSQRQSGRIGFAVKCTCCGEVWRFKTGQFSLTGTVAENENKQIVLDAIWKREWDIAYNKALEEALEHYSFCPICKNLSCEKCFCICDSIDMCKFCAKKLGEHGETVDPQGSP